MHDHSVVHPGEHVTVRVPKSATYIGSDRFDLYGVADAEVHVFAEAGPKKHLKKLYWIQFESYLPSKPDLTHDYTDNRRANYWGTTTWVRAGPAPTSGPSRPGSDREHVQAILERAGYTIPPEVMNVRLVQLLDDPQGTGHGRRELMLIYSEDLSPSGKTLKELSTDGKPNASWAPLEPGLIKRATTQFSVQRK
ncbi:MAG TPA: hypothetical protein VH392_01960 [Sphingomicrobium sp.]